MDKQLIVIPDIHLKPWIIDAAEKQMKTHKIKNAVFLGDIADDWKQEYNESLYEETYDRVIKFLHDHKTTIFCIGNHDISYVWQKMESGYSNLMQPLVAEKMSQIKRILGDNMCYIKRIDNTLFSHGGLSQEFITNIYNTNDPASLDDLIAKINREKPGVLWSDISPLWMRPAEPGFKMHPWPENMLQVTGHTPVRQPTTIDGFLMLDVFSTYSDGRLIGSQEFVAINPDTKEWEVLS